MLPLLRRPLQFLSSLGQVGELVRIDLGRLPMIVITDAKLTRQVLLDSLSFATTRSALCNGRPRSSTMADRCRIRRGVGGRRA